MKYKDFEDFLMEKCMKENPMVLDDDSIDFFNDWICDRDVEEWFRYGDEYIKAAYAESVPTLSDDEIISLALTSGFMLSTQYGQEKEKIMPVSDKNTLVTFYKAIMALLTSKGEEI